MVAEIDPLSLGGPGIYFAEMAVFDAEGLCVAVNNQFYLVVEQSLFGNFQYSGPPSIAEIRLELRDSSPLENDLLDDSVAFDNSEIAMCLRNCVDYWNESLPPVSRLYHPELSVPVLVEAGDQVPALPDRRRMAPPQPGRLLRGRYFLRRARPEG